MATDNERKRKRDAEYRSLRLIVRRLVDKAADGDLQAIKEVLDRIDGKTMAGPGDAEACPQQVTVRWKNAISSSSATSPVGDSSPSAGAASASSAS